MIIPRTTKKNMKIAALQLTDCADPEDKECDQLHEWMKEHTNDLYWEGDEAGIWVWTGKKGESSSNYEDERWVAVAQGCWIISINGEMLTLTDRSFRLLWPKISAWAGENALPPIETVAKRKPSST